MAEQDDKSAALGKTGEQSTIDVGCAPGEERDSAIGICAVHSPTVTAAAADARRHLQQAKWRSRAAHARSHGRPRGRYSLLHRRP